MKPLIAVLILFSGLAMDAQKVTSAFGVGAYSNISHNLVLSPPFTWTASLGAGAGAVTNGQHFIYLTFVTATGETSDLNNNCATTVTIINNAVNGKIHIANVPLGPSPVIARNFYISPANLTGGGCHNGLHVPDPSAVTAFTIPDNTTTSFDINVADAGLDAQTYPIINTTAFCLDATSPPNIGGIVPYRDFCYDPETLYTLINGTGLTFDFGGPSIGVAAVGDLLFTAYPPDSSLPAYLFLSQNFVSGTIPSNVPTIRVSPQYFGSDGYANKVGAPHTVWDIDSAVDIPAGKAILSCYNGEDGSHFSGGFSTAGGFCGTGLNSTPTDAMWVNAGTVFPTRAVNVTRGAASQSASLHEWRKSDDTVYTSLSSVGVVDKYNSAAKAANENGVPFSRISTSQVAQAANIGATSLIASATAGRYRASCYIAVTQQATTSSSVPDCNLICTDPTDSVVKTIQITPAIAGIAVNPTTGVGVSSSGICDAKAATAIQYSVTGYGSVGGTAMQYKVYLILEAM